MAVRPDTTTKSSSPASAKNEEDLEQYGVWVKAEPQDILEEPEVLSLGSSEFDLPSDEALPGADSFLTDDEERLLGSFDSLEDEGEAGLAPPSDVDSVKSGDFVDIPNIENLPPLQDFEIGEAPMGAIEDIGASTIDISLDELESSVDLPSPISPHAKLDPMQLSGLGPGSTKAPAASEPGTSDMEDVSAEFLDLEDGGGSTQDTSDVTSEFLDAEDGQAPSLPAASVPDFEPIDMDLHFEDSVQAPAGGAEPGFEAISEFDDFLAEEAPVVPNPIDFDDLSAVEKDLASPPPQREAHPAQAVEASLSNDLLLKIAEELSSIRGELVTLKSQLGALKPEERHEEEKAKEDEGGIHVGGGFFDEEEDETIALTGDELDNILNTADFTEENAEGDEAAEPPVSEDLLVESLLPESGDYRSEEPAIEEIRLEPAAEARPAALPEGDGLAELGLDEGVQHITQAPEDTTYLEEPLPGEEPLDLSEIPLHEESLADAESYPLELEGEEIEPIEEISEELPVVEGSGDFAIGNNDITLDLEADVDYINDTPSEMENLEPIPELEDIGFGELSLAEESAETVAEEVPEELEELVIEGEAPPSLDGDSFGTADLEATIDEKTVKPSQPVSFHPDDLPTSLDDSFFVGAPRVDQEEALDLAVEEMEPPAKAAKPEASPQGEPVKGISIKSDDTDRLKGEIKDVLSYLDKLLESLPESKIEEFAQSEHYDTYKRLFEELGLV